MSRRRADMGASEVVGVCRRLPPFVGPSSTEEAQVLASDLAMGPRAGEPGVRSGAADEHAPTWAPTFAARGDPPCGVAGGPLPRGLAATAANCGRQRPTANQGVAFFRGPHPRSAAGSGPRIPGGRPSGDPRADGAARVPGIRGPSGQGAFNRIRSARTWASEAGLWILTTFTDTSRKELCCAELGRDNNRLANWRPPPTRHGSSLADLFGGAGGPAPNLASGNSGRLTG